MKNPKVNVYCSDARFKLKVSVYRHVTSPDEISVHIEEVYPIPLPSTESVADNKGVAQIISPNTETVFLAGLYPS